MKLLHQITAAMLTTMLLVVALVAASMYVSVERGFARYVRGLEEGRLTPAVERLSRFYAREHGWDELVRDPGRLAGMLRREEGDEPPPGGPPEDRQPRADDGAGPPPPRDGAESDRRPPPGPRRDRSRADNDPLELPRRATLYDASRRRLVGEGSLESDASRIPIIVEGRTVGWLGIRPIPRLEGDLDLQYMHQVREQLLVIAVVATILGLLAGWLLARRLLRPIDSLRGGTRRLTTGDYEARIPVRGSAELSQLARDFNALAATLAADERARRQWVADTSHELRTPIAVLRAEIEAMLDGVRSIDMAAIGSLHTELLRLGKVVDDLGELARADSGTLVMTKLPVEPVALLRDSIAVFRGRFERRSIGIELDVAEAEHARISGDSDRVKQVYANLLENSARYTDEGGVLRVSATVEQDEIHIRFDDSAPAVPAESLSRLFDRFYRAEASRSREHGGSGLGLSICQRLVEAHDGTIAALPSPLGGLRIEISFPLLPGGTPRKRATAP